MFNLSPPAQTENDSDTPAAVSENNGIFIPQSLLSMMEANAHHLENGYTLIENEDGSFVLLCEEGIPRGFYRQDENGKWIYFPEDSSAGELHFAVLWALTSMALIFTTAGIYLIRRMKKLQGLVG